MIVRDYSRNVTSHMKSHLVRYAYILGGIVLFFWVVEFFDLIFLRGRLDYYGGVQPRTLVGLRNVFFSPFLHAGFGHLFTNMFPFLILGAFVLVRSLRDFILVSIIAALFSGLGIWLLGSGDSVHLGASGVVFGYLGYLLLRGYFERSIISIVLAVLSLVFYGGMIWGVLPLRPGVSWLGHLFGFIGGGVAAYYLADRGTVPRTIPSYAIEKSQD